MEINKVNKNKNLERKGKTEKGAIRKIKNKKLEGLRFGKNEGRRQGGALHGKDGGRVRWCVGLGEGDKRRCF